MKRKKVKAKTTGNVFKDLVTLGHGDFEAAVLLVKLTQRIVRKNLDPEFVAPALGIDLQTLGALISGQLSGFSVARIKVLLDDLERAFPSRKKARPERSNEADRAASVATRVATTEADCGGLLRTAEESSTL